MVKARNVPQGPQPFALAAIGVLGEVEFHDVTTTFIMAPTDTVDSGSTITPMAEVRNFGTFAETLNVRFSIGTGYSDSVVLTLGAGAVDTVSFLEWGVDSLGTFAVTCSTGLAGDANPGNNAVRESVVVRSGAGIEDGSNMPRAFSLDRAAPNPFGGTTAIRYAIPRLTSAKLSVYSAMGAQVRTLQNGKLEPGYYSAAWNGRDGFGRLLPSGIYLFRLQAGNYSATGKVLLSR
jgi:hypothetical protein